MNDVTVKPSFSQKLVMVLAVVGIFTIPVTWVFSFPVDQETPIAILLAICAPIIAYVYMTFRHVVRIRNSQLLLTSSILIPEKPIDVSQIEEVTLHRSIKRTSLDIKLRGGQSLVIPTHAFETEQLIQIIHALNKINPNISIPSEAGRMVGVFDDKQALKLEIIQFEKTESDKLLKVIAVAAAVVFSLWIYGAKNGEGYSARQLVDIFSSLLN